jgi:hypothetical protein
MSVGWRRGALVYRLMRNELEKQAQAGAGTLLK